MRGARVAFGQLPWPVRLLVWALLGQPELHAVGAVQARLGSSQAAGGDGVLHAVVDNVGQVLLMGKKACTPLIVEQQIDAVKVVYAGKVDYTCLSFSSIESTYPTKSCLQQACLC